MSAYQRELPLAPIQYAEDALAATRPDYLVIRYPFRCDKGAVMNSAPTLVETFDYLHFYAAGRPTPAAMSFLGYEVLASYPPGTDYGTVRETFISWRHEKINHWATSGAYLTN